MNRPWSLRTRLLTSLAFLAAGLFTFGGLQNYYAYRESSRRLFDDSLRESANLLLQLAEHEMMEHGGVLGETLLLAETSSGPYGFRFQIWTPDMQQRSRQAVLKTRPLQDFSVDGFGWTSNQGERWRSYSAWNPKRTIQIQIVQRAEQRDSLNEKALLRLATEAVVLLAIACALIWWIVTATIRPLQQIADSVGNRGEHDFGPVEARNAPREAQPVLDALNRLLRRVGNALHLERRFTADAAHELRTPLAAIRANAQVLAAARNQAEREATARDLIASVDRNTRLVEQLLSLTRADQPVAADRTRDLDLAQIAEEQLTAHQVMAAARGVNLVSSLQPCPVTGDASLLSALLRNLIDNALRYTPAGGNVKVGTLTEGDSAVLIVEDDGPGIPATERDRVFERFYRVAGVQATGSGLGLSIAQRIVLLHNGRIELDAGTAGKGTRVRVVLPASQATL